MNETENNSNDNEGEEKRPKLESIHTEYQNCGALARFFVGIRFSYFASFITFFIVLVGSYHYVWNNSTDFGILYPYTLFAVSFFGLGITLAAWMIELRNIFLYQACDRRMATLEQRMTINDGIYIFFTSPMGRGKILRIKISHTYAIYTVYSLITITWSMLLIYSIYLVLSSWIAG